MNRFSIYVGNPDTGKTYKAINLAKENNIDHILVMCNQDMTLDSILNDFIIDNNQPVFKESLVLKAITSKEKIIVILDELNTLMTSTMKSLQPLLDDTSETFAYRGKVYKKNPNCVFIATLNHNDAGISRIPKALLSRASVTFFQKSSEKYLRIDEEKDFAKDLKSLYQLFHLMDIFGMRQVKVCRQFKTQKEYEAHIKGLCICLGLEYNKIIKLLETKHLIKQLVKYAK